MDKWAEYYVGRVGETYPDYCEERYAPFIAMVTGAAGNNNEKSFREEGCGIGTFTKILRRRDFHNVSAFDLSRDMAHLASVNTQMNVRQGNILSEDKDRDMVDVVLSHGVLEHFQDNVIHRMIALQRARCRALVHYVPTDGYKEPSFGDERLLPVEYWVRNFEPANHFVFNDGCDLAMMWVGGATS